MKKNNTRLLANIMFNCMVALMLSTVLSINAAAAIIGVNALGLMMHYAPISLNNQFNIGLAQEVWIADVLENPYPTASFLQAAKNLSSLVDNDVINLAEAGVDPNVLVDNVVYPVPIVAASDIPKTVTLKTYDTENTVVRNAIAVELAYDQRQLYINKHKKALAKKVGMDAAYMYAPVQADAVKNNFIKKLAANDSIIDGIIDLAKDYRNADADDDMHLVLSPNHEAAIAKEDKKLYKAMLAEPGMEYCGFKLWRYTKNPIYITATGVKAAYGAAYAAGTHSFASISFLGSEVMVADGSAEMFARLKDPEARGDIFGFQKRALATTLRGCFGGAILQ